MTLIDQQVGQVLKELNETGDAEHPIVMSKQNN